jgi:DAACS family dicarboxylate/amino acid:cation (Na+ or H+) symporter
MANIVKMAEWKKIILGLIAGIAAGIIFDDKIVVIEPLGKLFIRLIKMLIIPLVLSSLVVGIYSIRDIKKLGKIGGKTIIIFLGTTLIAVVIGMLMGYIIQPGEGLQLSSSVTSITPKKKSTAYFRCFAEHISDEYFWDFSRRKYTAGYLFCSIFRHFANAGG